MNLATVTRSSALSSLVDTNYTLHTDDPLLLLLTRDMILNENFTVNWSFVQRWAVVIMHLHSIQWLSRLHRPLLHD